MKNILIISPYLPWPLKSGGNTGVFYLLEYISHCENVYFMTIYNKDYNTYKYLNQLKEKLPKVHFLMYDYRNTQYKKYEYFRKLFRHLGLNVNFGGSKCNMSQLNLQESITPGLIDFVSTTIQEKNINVVQIDFLDLRNLVYALPNYLKKVFIHHELGWVRNEQTYGNDIFSTFFKKCMKDNEISILNNFDVIGAMTAIDQNKLLEAGVKTKIIVSTSAISNTTFDYHEPTFDGRLTFVGGSGHFPNFDGIKWFVKNVLPLIKRHHKNISLEIIGNWSETAQKEVHKICKDIKFLGFVDDLGATIQDSLMIVPINIGSGIRMKILEAANYSVPFVSTIVGVEGLDFEDNKECFICKTPEGMAEKIVKLIQNKDLFKSFSINVHKKFVEKYSIEALGQKRLSLYE